MAKHYRKSAALTAYKEFPGCSHFTVGQDGWEEVADYALNWARRARRGTGAHEHVGGLSWPGCDLGELVVGVVTMIASVLDVAALKTAARAAIVMPAVFAFADTAIGQPQTSIFAAFGSFAVLVLVDVEGPPLPRLFAYLALAAMGVGFITLGSVCSRNAWLGAGVMAVIGFCVLMSGVINGYVAALSTGALLLFVLPVTIPAPNSAIPDRLEGWALAAGVGTCAVMLLWPSRRRADLQHDAAGAMRAVARVAAAPDGADENLRVARDAVDRLGRRSLGSQHRPTGPTGPTAALAALGRGARRGGDGGDGGRAARGCGTARRSR